MEQFVIKIISLGIFQNEEDARRSDKREVGGGEGKRSLHQHSQRSWMVSREISGLNEVGRLSVTGYRCARDRGGAPGTRTAQ